MKVVRNSLNYDYKKQSYEVNKLPSLTVPDQAMEVREIMSRFANGLGVDGQRVPIYDLHDSNEALDVLDDLQDLVPENFRHLDLADREALLNEHRDHLALLRQRVYNGLKKYPKKTPPAASENVPAEQAKNGGSEADASKSQGAAATGSDRK